MLKAGDKVTYNNVNTYVRDTLFTFGLTNKVLTIERTDGDYLFLVELNFFLHNKPMLAKAAFDKVIK